MRTLLRRLHHPCIGCKKQRPHVVHWCDAGACPAAILPTHHHGAVIEHRGTPVCSLGDLTGREHVPSAGRQMLVMLLQPANAIESMVTTFPGRCTAARLVHLLTHI